MERYIWPICCLYVVCCDSVPSTSLPMIQSNIQKSSVNMVPSPAKSASRSEASAQDVAFPARHFHFAISLSHANSPSPASWTTR